MIIFFWIGKIRLFVIITLIIKQKTRLAIIDVLRINLKLNCWVEYSFILMEFAKLCGFLTFYPNFVFRNNYKNNDTKNRSISNRNTPTRALIKEYCFLTLSKLWRMVYFTSHTLRIQTLDGGNILFVNVGKFSNNCKHFHYLL